MLMSRNNLVILRQEKETAHVDNDLEKKVTLFHCERLFYSGFVKKKKFLDNK